MNDHTPPPLCAERIHPHLTAPHRTPLTVLPTVDSTNSYAIRRALSGDFPDGTAIAADEQTGGRGRLGRSFLSPPREGLYLTLLWKPSCDPVQTLSFPAFVAVAVCDGIEAACGVHPGIKWTNDIVLGQKKLCGILTEMAVDSHSGMPQYLIAGVGVNVNQTSFPPELQSIATSLSLELGHSVDRNRLCALLVNALDEMYASWLSGGGDYLRRYRERCVTLGKTVRLIRENRTEEAYAEDIDDGFGLIVRHPDGRRETVTAGEVSVRGLCGYTD